MRILKNEPQPGTRVTRGACTATLKFSRLGCIQLHSWQSRYACHLGSDEKRKHLNHVKRQSSAKHGSGVAVECNGVLTNGKPSVAPPRQLVEIQTLNPDQHGATCLPSRAFQIKSATGLLPRFTATTLLEEDCWDGEGVGTSVLHSLMRKHERLLGVGAGWERGAGGGRGGGSRTPGHKISQYFPGSSVRWMHMCTNKQY
jgi:hypothetical protein